jgi:hypothetical protein
MKKKADFEEEIKNSEQFLSKVVNSIIEAQ